MSRILRIVVLSALLGAVPARAETGMVTVEPGVDLHYPGRGPQSVSGRRLACRGSHETFLNTAVGPATVKYLPQMAL
jgi:hypothetical protein